MKLHANAVEGDGAAQEADRGRGLLVAQDLDVGQARGVVNVYNRSLRELLAARGIQHRRIPPRTPKPNGKVERYQQTLAREWAYGQRYAERELSRFVPNGLSSFPAA